jgi:t-SNARE complex subunit (syntaxin)
MIVLFYLCLHTRGRTSERDMRSNLDNFVGTTQRLQKFRRLAIAVFCKSDGKVFSEKAVGDR